MMTRMQLSGQAVSGVPTSGVPVSGGPRPLTLRVDVRALVTVAPVSGYGGPAGSWELIADRILGGLAGR